MRIKLKASKNNESVTLCLMYKGKRKKHLNFCIVSNKKKKNKKIKKIFKKFIISFSSIVCFTVCVYCFIDSLPKSISSNRVTLSTAAAGLVMPDGAKTTLVNSFSEEKEETRPEQAPANEKISLSENITTVKNSNAVVIETCSDVAGIVESGIPNIVAAPGEATYPVIERQVENEGDCFENVYVKNYSKTAIDIATELSIKPELDFKLNSSEPQILVYHTHTTESYMPSDSNVFPQSFYSRTTNKDYSVAAVGKTICEKLQENGISVVHDTSIHDNPSYNGSYYRSEDTIHAILEKYPSIIATIDVHRDAIGSATSKSKAVFNSKQGKAAQVMIICGCGENGVENFPNWRQNLRFGLRVQQKLANNERGITRSLKFCDRQYNLNATKGSLLVEVGTDVNTLDEAKKSGTMLGEAISQVAAELSSK